MKRVVLYSSFLLLSFLRPKQDVAEVAVLGNDYAFTQLPATLAEGKTLFSFENRGKVRHEFSMLLLRPGVTVDDVARGRTGAPSSRAVSESIIGLLIARPSESGGGKLLVDLKAGQHYLVVCTLKDLPDSRTHMELGMFGGFEVK